MGSIQKGTDKIAEEHKIQEMKKIAEALRTKAKRMEESEHAQHINPKDLKQLAKDAAALEKAAEKLKAAFDKKFNKKEKAAAPKAEAEKSTLQENTVENTFDLKKFLTENKLTANSRLVNENVNDLFLDAIFDYINDELRSGNIEEDDFDVIKNYIDSHEEELSKHQDQEPQDVADDLITKAIQGLLRENGEGMDFGTGSEIQAVINHLIDNDRQDILDVLGKIPAWNTLVDQASDI